MKYVRAMQILQGANIFNPMRLVKLMRRTIERLDLNLSGLTILTEAASGPYVVTPVIASLAGAKQVLALTRDSRYASSEEVITQTRALETLCGVTESKCVQIYKERSLDLFAQADIITNLGFVRPIDAEAVAVMKTTAIVPLMYESWEYRPEDVDLEECRNKGITVLGTNEDYPGLDVFEYSGWLALKMIFLAQIEIHKSKILIVSGDKFGRVIKRRLQCCGALVDLVSELRSTESRAILSKVDVLFLADYARSDAIIGTRGDLSGEELAQMAPAITVIQFAGSVELGNLSKHNVAVFPNDETSSHHMAFTLAELGPRPVIELHTAGFKVGQIGIQANRVGTEIERDDLDIISYSNLAQHIP